MGKISSRYDGKPAAAEPAFDADIPPDVDEIIVDGLRKWMHINKHQLPQPCPTQFADCAAWWRSQMQEPEQRGETFLRGGGAGGEAPRWECGYAIRLRTTLLRFISLTAPERSLIVGAREDGIFWRGEEISAFVGVVEETMRMRAMGVPAYRQQAIGRLKGLFGTAIREAA